MHKIAALLAAIAAFAMASHQDYVDAELVSPPAVVACIHCAGER